MQKVDIEASFIKCNENCGLPDLFTDYQIRHLGNPSGLPEILLKIDPWLRNADGGGGCLIFWKKRYEGVMFNVISVTRGWVGVQFPEK